MDTQAIINICLIALSNIFIVWRMCRMVEKTQLVGGESKEVLLKRIEEKPKRSDVREVQARDVFGS